MAIKNEPELMNCIRPLIGNDRISVDLILISMKSRSQGTFCEKYLGWPMRRNFR